MVCEKCKAEYDSTFEKCPYCGEPVKIRPVSKHELKVRRNKKVISILLICILGIITAYSVYGYFTGTGSRSYKNKQKNLVLLKKYLSEDNYEDIYNLVKNIKNASKDKDYICYYSLFSIYGKGKNYIENSRKAAEIMKTKDYDLITENVKEAFTSLAAVYEEAQRLMAKYSLEKNNNEYIDKIMDYFMKDSMNVYMLSSDEITEIFTIGSSEEEIIDTYSDVVYRKISDEAFITDDIKTEE